MSNLSKYNIKQLEQIVDKFGKGSAIQSLNETTMATHEPTKENLLWGDYIEEKNGFDVLLECSVNADNTQPELFKNYTFMTRNGEEYEFRLLHFEQRTDGQYYAVVTFDSEYTVPLKEVFKVGTNFRVGRNQWSMVQVPKFNEANINTTTKPVNMEGETELYVRTITNVPAEVGALLEDNIDPDLLFSPENSPVKRVLEEHTKKLEATSEQMARLTSGDTDHIYNFISELAKDDNPSGEALKLYEKLQPMLENLEHSENLRMSSDMYMLKGIYSSVKESLEQKRLIKS